MKPAEIGLFGVGEAFAAQESAVIREPVRGIAAIVERVQHVGKRAVRPAGLGVRRRPTGKQPLTRPA